MKLSVQGNFVNRAGRSFAGLWVVPALHAKSVLIATKDWAKAVEYARERNAGMSHREACDMIFRGRRPLQLTFSFSKPVLRPRRGY
jgi:hypothetical protein